MLKTCKKCGNPYGFDDNFMYSCNHHKIEAKGYPLPTDFLNIRGIITKVVMTKSQFIKKYVTPQKRTK